MYRKMAERSVKVKSIIRYYHAYKNMWHPEIEDRQKMRSSINMIDTPWEVSKMNKLSNTLHVKY